MKTKTAVNLGRLMIFMGINFLFAGCALFSTYEDPPEKNSKIKFEDPATPFRKIDESTADSIWQSMKTGNTIAINSSCAKDEGSIKNMEDGILAGVENLKSRTTKKISLDGVTADRIHAEGSTDGVLVDIDLVVIRKAICTYDLAYVARHVTFAEEVNFFEQFIRGFHAP